MSLCILGHEKSGSNIKLLEESRKIFKSVFLVPISEVNVGLGKEFMISYRNSDLLRFDAILPRIPRIHYQFAYQLLSLFPRETFMPIQPISFLVAAERFFMLTVMRKRGVETLRLEMARSPAAAARVLNNVVFPVVIRLPGKKTGIPVASRTEAKSVTDALGSLDQTILIEEPVKEMVSVYVAHPQAIAAVRKKTKEKDAVFSEGALKKFRMEREICQLALDAAAALSAMTAKIDIALMEDRPVVANVELDPELLAASRVSGVNIPRRIVESVYESCREHADRPLLLKFFDDAQSVVREVMKNRHSTVL
jgi:glutathione synthase/RimK-type ligase-like ATP-grasp enzyme